MGSAVIHTVLSFLPTSFNYRLHPKAFQMDEHTHTHTHLNGHGQPDLYMSTKPSRALSVSVELRGLTLSSSPGSECLMLSDSVQMDSSTVQRRSFTSFSSTDEMNNK